jgi:hypothetical protein
MKKQKNQVSATVQSWSESLGKDATTIKRKLNQQSIPFTPGKPIPARDVFRALTAESDKDVAITERTREQTRKEKRENDVAEARLYDLDLVNRLVWHDILYPLRSELFLMPGSLAPRCSGSDTETARDVLQTWVDETLKKINAAQPNVKPSDNPSLEKSDARPRTNQR